MDGFGYVFTGTVEATKNAMINQWVDILLTVGFFFVFFFVVILTAQKFSCLSYKPALKKAFWNQFALTGYVKTPMIPQMSSCHF